MTRPTERRDLADVTPGSPNDSPACPHRRSYRLLALGFIAFAIYASLLPFDLHWISTVAAWDQFRSTVLAPPGRVSRSDVLANTLLFVPVGFSLAGSLLADRWSWRRLLMAAVPIVLVSASVSLVTEYLQVYAPGRVPSGVDVAAQTLGCIIGVFAWMTAGDAVTRWVRAALDSAREDRLSQVLAAYLAAWLFVSFAPFDITLDVGDLAARVRSGHITVIPFAGPDRLPTERIWDAVAEVLSAAPLGALGLIGLKRRSRRSSSSAWAFGTALVVVVEMAQVFIRSHAADITDVLCGSVGVGLGVWIGGRALTRTHTVQPDAMFAAVSWRALAASVAACAIVIFYHWQPFDFAVNEDLIRQKLRRLSLLPFAGYGSGSYLNALNDLLTKLALAMPLGVSASFVYRRQAAHGLIAVACVLFTGVLFVTIEGGQFFLAARVPDPTDVFVGLTGTCIGFSLGRWLRGDSPPSPNSPQAPDRDDELRGR